MDIKEGFGAFRTGDMRETEGLDDGSVCGFGDWWGEGREHEGAAGHADEALEERFWGVEQVHAGDFMV